MYSCGSAIVLLIDGSLHSIAALGERGAAVLARLQTGQLQFYAFLVLPELSVRWLGLGAMSEATLLNIVLYLPLVGIAAIVALPWG